MVHLDCNVLPLFYWLRTWSRFHQHHTPQTVGDKQDEADDQVGPEKQKGVEKYTAGDKTKSQFVNTFTLLLTILTLIYNLPEHISLFFFLNASGSGIEARKNHKKNNKENIFLGFDFVF